jgi:hypothetical protein
MTRRLSQRIRAFLPRSIIPLLVICMGCVSATAVAAPGRMGAAPSLAAAREIHLTRVVSVLESRIPSHELSEKTKAKLLTLNDRQVRIAASLADRIAEEEHGAVAETAFFLLTVLIILS